MTKITKQMVEERLKLYQTELQQLYALIKVYEGGTQDCNHWLTVLESEEKGTIDG